MVTAGALSHILDTRLVEPARRELVSRGLKNSPARDRGIAAANFFRSGGVLCRLGGRFGATDPPASRFG